MEIRVMEEEAVVVLLEVEVMVEVEEVALIIPLLKT
jgi:hypothetical protein